MTKPLRIDWSLIVNDLLRAGVSLPEIAAALEVSQGAPYRWLDGSEPGHYNGELLLALHRRHCEIHQGEGARAQHPARTQVENPKGDNDERAREERRSERRRRAAGG